MRWNGPYGWGAGSNCLQSGNESHLSMRRAGQLPLFGTAVFRGATLHECASNLASDRAHGCKSHLSTLVPGVSCSDGRTIAQSSANGDRLMCGKFCFFAELRLHASHSNCRLLYRGCCLFLQVTRRIDLSLVLYVDGGRMESYGSPFGPHGLETGCAPRGSSPGALSWSPLFSGVRAMPSVAVQEY